MIKGFGVTISKPFFIVLRQGRYKVFQAKYLVFGRWSRGLDFSAKLRTLNREIGLFVLALRLIMEEFP